MKNQKTLFTLTVAAILVLVLGSAFNSAPQETQVYEYATITQSGVSWLAVASTGGNYNAEKLSLSKPEVSSDNTRPLMGKVIEFQKNGWELMGITHLLGAPPMGLIHVADMRRPIVK